MPLQKPQSPSRTRRKATASLTFQRAAIKQGFSRIAGVDEAGRGPLAGPVVAAACLIKGTPRFPGINDSKLLSPEQRKAFFHRLIHHSAVSYGLGIVDAETIDTINIYQATIKAMHLALDALPERPDYLLVDAIALEYGMPCVALIHGDARCQAIAAASIIAKESRDALMLAYHVTYPEYGFDRHKGYGTVAHKAALKKHGPCAIHRRSFQPVREALVL